MWRFSLLNKINLILNFKIRKVLCRGGTNQNYTPLSKNITRIAQGFYKTKQTIYASEQ
jgi:hypothetical protein